MAPIVYISLFLFTLVAACLAEIVSLRTSALPSHNSGKELTERSLPYDNAKPESVNDLELLDIVLVASVDGKFHALNRTSGHVLWSMSSVASSITGDLAPPSLAPLVRTNHIDSDPDLTDDNNRQETYIIEPQSGDIYVMETPSSPLTRFPFSMADLVDMSPFNLRSDGEHRVFVGRKQTSLLLVELETGTIKATLNPECPWDPYDDLHEDLSELDLDELEGSKPQVSSPREVFIGRTGESHQSSHSTPIKRAVFF